MRVDAAVNLMQQIPGFGHVRFIILYGSVGKPDDKKNRISISASITRENVWMRPVFRHAVLSRLSGTGYDIQIFQHLPLYVRVEVLKGKPVFVRSARFLYDKATETLRDFEEFKYRAW